MEKNNTLQGTTIKLWLKRNGFFYQGLVVLDDEHFFRIKQIKDGKIIGFNKDELSSYEVVSND